MSLLLLFAPSSAPAGITIANSTTYDGSFLPAHTISAFDTSGTNPYLFVLGGNKNPAVEVTTVTADLSAMTLIDSSINANVVAIQGYGVIPTDASTDIVVGTPTFKEWAGIAVNLNGVDQTTPYNATTVKDQGFGSTASASITGTAGSMLLILGSSQNDRTLTLTGTGVTQQENFSPTSGIGTMVLGYVEATGSSQTLGFTLSSADNYRLMIVEIYKAVSTTTTDKTITGLSRITALITRTLQGRSRIANLTTKTQQGRSNISVVTSKTILGRSRVTALLTRTQLARARIAALATRTITGRSRVAVFTTKTQVARSRIQVTTTKTITARTRIGKVVSATILGRANIVTSITTTTKTILARARVTVLQARTQLARARITRLGRQDSTLVNGMFNLVPAGSTPTTATARYIDGTAGGAVTDVGGFRWYHGKTGTVSALIDTVNTHNGFNSLHINVSASGSLAEVRNGATGYFNGSIYSIKKGTTYRISYWTKAENVTGSAATGMAFDILTNTSANTSAGTLQQTIGSSAHDWTFRTYDYTTSATAEFYHVEARVYAHNGAGTLQGDFYFSEIRVEELGGNIRAMARVATLVTKTLLARARILKQVSATMLARARITVVGPPRINLVTNPSFEVDISTWTLYASATLARVTTDAKFGGASLQVTNAGTVGGGGSAGGINRSFTMVPDTTYTFSAWVKLVGGTQTQINIYTPLGSGSSTSTNITLGQWVRVKHTFSTTSAAYINQIYLRAWGSNQPNAVWLTDGIMLEQATDIRPFFDGASGGAWTGTAHASTSTSDGIVMTAIARIATLTTRTILGRARIATVTTRTLLARSRILNIVTRTITARARIALLTLKTITGRTRIAKQPSQTIGAKAYIIPITAPTEPLALDIDNKVLTLGSDALIVGLDNNSESVYLENTSNKVILNL